MNEVQGRLVLAGTPIGNPADATARLRGLIETADLIAAEDTRRFRRLCADLGLSPPAQVISCYDANEAQRAEQLCDRVAAGDLVLVVSDAGMPTVSDPGFRLVRLARAQDLPVAVAPGVSAVTAALAVSGLPSDRFVFEGFLPRKGAARRERISELSQERRTIVLFESANRFLETVTNLADSLGRDRSACMCREITKTYEEILPGTLGELATRAEATLKGEITLVVGGATDSLTADTTALVVQAITRISEGENQRDVVADIARRNGVSRRELYNAVLAARATS